LTILLGGWDDYQMFMFGKAVDLSGPSKPFFKPLYKFMQKCVSLAKRLGTHGKFPIPHEKAHQQATEIMRMKTEKYQHQQYLKN